jgi:hypothetical protein
MDQITVTVSMAFDEAATAFANFAEAIAEVSLRSPAPISFEGTDFQIMCVETVAVLGWHDSATRWQILDCNSLLYRMDQAIWPLGRVSNVLGFHFDLNKNWLPKEGRLFNVTVEYAHSTEGVGSRWSGRGASGVFYWHTGEGRYVRSRLVAFEEAEVLTV